MEEKIEMVQENNRALQSLEEGNSPDLKPEDPTAAHLFTEGTSVAATFFAPKLNEGS